MYKKNSKKYNKSKKWNQLMKISDLNPHIRYAQIHHLFKPLSTSFSICYDCRIFYIEKANGFITANETKYDISNDTVIYFPPETKYKFSFPENTDFKVIVFNFDLINDFSEQSSSLGTATEQTFIKEKAINYSLPQKLSAPIVKQLPQIRQTLEKCTENFLQKISFYRENSSALLKLCLLELIRENTKKHIYSQLCDDVTAYIHTHYAQPTLSNDLIAEKFNYHPYHLSRIIKEQTGKTLHQYLVYYRLRIAKNLLLTTQYDIEHIAWKSGFSSTAYFIKIFREHTGTTPNKYRKLRFHTEL